MTSRRQFLKEQGFGIGSVALAYLLQQEEARARPESVVGTTDAQGLEPRAPHAEPRANAMISLFMHGGPSHIDLFDPKPELEKHDGETYDENVDFSFKNRASKKLMASPWKFHPRGDSGIEMSELLPHLGEVADELCVIRSMRTDINGHAPSVRYLNTGSRRVGRPVLGSWVTYGLGTENQNLPAYAVLTDPGGLPVDGTNNWSNGWLPSTYQGTVIRPTEPRILNLDPPEHLKGKPQARNLEYLSRLNEQHLQNHDGAADLEARIRSYELAARMQTAASDALDISGEPDSIKRMYGLEDKNKKTREYGTRCLLARRLVERGVRFVQLFINAQIWDNHNNISKALPDCCRKTDKPAAALIKDLKQRGLLETTLVQWGGEIGRLPVVEDHGNPKKAGRDHNGQGFTMWLAGGGVKGGITYRSTHELGHHAVYKPVTPHDYHATLMDLFGLDHQKLTYIHNRQKRTITKGKPASVLTDIMA